MTLRLLTPRLVRLDNYAAPFWDALPDEQRADLEDRIPAGHVVSVTTYRSKRGHFTVRLLRASLSESQPSILVRALRGHDLGYQMRALLDETRRMPDA